MATFTLTPVTPTGVSKSWIKWKDPQTGRWLRDEISDAEYRALATARFPKQPQGFTGTAKAWQDAWLGREAIALQRPEFNTSSGQMRPGDYWENGDEVLIVTDDLDNGVLLIVDRSTDLIGTLPMATLKTPVVFGGKTYAIMAGMLAF